MKDSEKLGDMIIDMSFQQFGDRELKVMNGDVSMPDHVINGEKLVHIIDALIENGLVKITFANECSSKETLNNWISVKYRLPERGDRVLIFHHDGVSIGSYHRNDDWHGIGIILRSVTHWMPLPQPPKETI